MEEKQHILITGGAGFIGSNFIRYSLKNNPQDIIINLDKLTYAGNLENLKDIEGNLHYHFVKGDICNYELIDLILKNFKIDTIVNFAAESHNSYAIKNPGVFFKTNVIGTQTLLQAAKNNKISRFHHISTCEVYGDLPLDSTEVFTENTSYKPRTPYNASKAAADMAVRSYFETFNLPITISNCCNNYGPFQFPEKLISLFTVNLIEDKEVSMYKSSQNKREWLHVLDHCKAIDLILRKGRIGQTYNIGSGIEKSVEEIAQIIFQTLNKPEILKKYVPDRPGHDRRYLLDSSKIKIELGWEPEINFDYGMRETIQWYKNNKLWWEPLKQKLQVQESQWN
jgi:dTDP-glucose 4,6-dehydratase